jgi:hypothetical protein
MDFWQRTKQQPSYAMAAPRVPEQKFTNTLQNVLDQPGYGEALAALTSANQQVRMQRGKKN